ncbi:MAG: NOP58 family protein [Candidatus Diapherotrites archaeon]|nr:NOP58 family protein [Candidatus Diapherotrites archaeon]
MSVKDLRKKALRKAKEKVREEKFRRDHLIIQAISAIDELDDVSNLMLERVRNWYALHYPELEKLVRSPETYLAIVKELQARELMTEDALKPLTAKAPQVAAVAKDSIGAVLGKKDLDRVAKLATLVVHMKQERDEIAQYVEDACAELCPNVHSIAGGMLAARLLAAAGSLEKLAEFPASTVQVLGAEKALFAHLKQGVSPPKHGLIFAYPAIRQAPKKMRGKIARAVANKLSIAARMDFFGHGLDVSLKQKLDAQVERITSAAK